MTQSQDHAEPLHPQAELRAPDTVMKLERMGAFFPTRLSFMRSTIRRLAEENATVRRSVWAMDEEGFGRAVYSIDLGGHTYSLIAFSTQIPPEMRTDRVIAEVWDSAYVLFDGVPTEADLDRLADNAPRQEAGRFLPSELILSRANKSVRLFEHVAQSLSQGHQPNVNMVAEIGYLMRTTAVYGNGKFGIADRTRIKDRPGLSGPFQAEMLTVWLIRNFTHDLVEHVARCRAPETFVPLEKALKRHLGIGNSTGLGMAPFLVSHPDLLNNWMMVRETALARVLAVEIFDPQIIARMLHLFQRVSTHLAQWNVEDERQTGRILKLRTEWAWLCGIFESDYLRQSGAGSKMMETASACSVEAQELVVALLLEPHGELVDGLSDCMASDDRPRLEPGMRVGELNKIIRLNYSWALNVDLSSSASRRQFWYVSEEKLEPRLGDRFEEEGAELELPHDIPLRVQQLAKDISEFADDMMVAEFVLRYPEHRYIIRRIQTTARQPYAEIRDNLVGENCLPIDMLRCKLSFFGASKFDPKSSRWTRITLYQGAPLPKEIATATTNEAADDWWLPVLDGV